MKRLARIALCLGLAACPKPAPSGFGGPPGGGGVAGGGVRCGTSDKQYALRPAVNLPGEGDFAPIAVGDLNGDGKADIVGGHAGRNTPSRGIAVYLNQGNGSFAPMVKYPWHYDGMAYEIELGDLDGDGDLDVVGMGEGANGNPGYMLNNGDGTFSAAVALPNGGESDGVMKVADFSGDGKLDIVVTDCCGVAVYLNAGDAKFGSPVQYKGEGDGLAVGDWNGDGRLDLATYLVDDDVGYSNVFLWMNQRNGTFAEPTKAALPTSREGKGVMHGLGAGDINGDGKADIAVLSTESYASDLYVLLGNGDGSFRPAAAYRMADFGKDASALTVADLNNDKRADVIVGNYATVVVFASTGDAMAPAWQVPAAPLGRAAYVGGGNEVAAADLTGSGVLSIVAGQPASYGQQDPKNWAMSVLLGACD